MEDPYAALVVISRSDSTLSAGYRVIMKGVPVSIARRLCSDPRTAGPHWMLAWLYESDLADRPNSRQIGKLYWHYEDNPALAEMLARLIQEYEQEKKDVR